MININKQSTENLAISNSNNVSKLKDFVKTFNSINTNTNDTKK